MKTVTPFILRFLLAGIVFVAFFLQQTFATNHYWVNGSGTWSDPAHWSAISGGTGGYGVPGKDDAVFIDLHSFNAFNQLISVIGSAECASLNWSDDRYIAALNIEKNAQLCINGSISLSAKMRFENEGVLAFCGSGGPWNIDFRQHTVGGAVQISGKGTWQLISPLKMDGDAVLKLQHGTLNVNGYSLSGGTFVAEKRGKKILNADQSLVQFDIWETSGAHHLVIEDNNAQLFGRNKLITARTGGGNPPTTQDVQTFTCFPPSAIDSIVLTATDVTCPLYCDGEVTAVIYGGTGPFGFDWAPGTPTGEGTDSIYNLCAAFYSVVVTDSADMNICQAGPIEVHGVPPFLMSINPQPAVSCSGVCDGSTTVFVSGGTTPYSYQWCNGETGQTATALCGGNCMVTVTDQNGCSDSLAFTVTEPAPLLVNTGSTNVQCNAACDGTAFSAPSGGTPPYSHSWNTGSTSDTLTGLCPGTYVDTVTDNNGCTAVDSVIITEPTLLTVAKDSTAITCGGACDGQVWVIPSGGTPPYSYSWNTGSTNDSLTSLCPGNYCVTVTDANGCQDSVCFTLTDPPILTVAPTGTDITCFNISDGTVSANAAGGTPPYTYSWNPPVACGNNPGCTGLPPGTYCVTVTDSQGCQDTGCVTITQPIVLTVVTSGTDPSCNGQCNGSVSAAPAGGTTPYTYNWNPPAACGNNASCGSLCAGTYNVTVTDANGCTATDSYTLIDPPALSSNVSSSDVTCFGAADGQACANPGGGTAPYTVTWSPPPTVGLCISPIGPGWYYVTIVDNNGCTLVDSVEILEPIAVNANPSVVSNVTCNGGSDGSVIANPTGGITPYSYNWSPGGCSTPACTGLGASTYCVTVTDANGCQDSSCVTVTEPTIIVANLSGSDPSCAGTCDGTISAAPGGGTGPYTYQWSCTLQTSATVTGICSGTCYVTVTDAVNCFIVDSFTLLDPPVLQLNDTASNILCFGACDGSITVSPSGGTPPYSYSWNTACSGPSCTGLCPGTYGVTVTDNNGCMDSVSYTITEPLALTLQDTSINESCGAQCDGVGAVIAAGGTPPYTYLWNNFSTNDTIFNLCSGTYIVTVTDANGCTGIDSVIITEVVTILINPQVVTQSCNGNCDGTATASASGGQSPYNYTWGPFSGNQTDSTATGLCPGWHYVTVCDANGCCNSDSIQIVAIPSVFQVADSAVNVSCNGSCDGEAWAVATGGVTPYVYNWPAIPSSNTGVTGLCPGTYQVYVTDGIGCLDSAMVTVTEPAPLSPNTGGIDVTCNTANDACVYAVPSGGTSPYTYQWSNGCNTDTCCGLAPGSYCVTVTDFNGCQDTSCVTVIEPTVLSYNSFSADASCNGACDGSANIYPTGGTPPYSFNWNPVVLPGDSTATGLCAGVYNVTISDSNNCTATQSFTINEPVVLSVGVISTDPSCNAACDGQVTANPSGGTAPYSYLWSNAATTPTITGLCDGTYCVTVTDFNGCQDSACVTLTGPNILTAAMSSTDANCNGDCNGTGTATPGGGTAPYTYQWDDPGTQTGQTATGLCAGTYNVTVTDFNGCTTTGSVTITEPSLIIPNSSTTDANCGVCDGTATVNPSGGVPPYTYSWSNGCNTNTCVGLCAGGYTVTITDLQNCDTIVSVVVNNIGGPTGATISATNVSCNGSCDGQAVLTNVQGGSTPYTYDWQDAGFNSIGQTGTTATGLCAGLYNLEITDNIGCIHNEPVMITQPDTIGISFLVSSPSCNGDCNGTAAATVTGGTSPYTYLWSNASTSTSVANLCAGTYLLTVTDANNCTRVDSVVVTEPTVLSALASSTDATCNGICDGTGTANGSGGTTPYTYQWDDPGTQTTQTATGLCAGNYNVTVSDAGGCSATASITITAPTTVNASASVTNATCGLCDGAISVTPSGGTSPYNYTWTGTGPLNPPPNPNINALCAGMFDLTITDAVGCTGTYSFGVSDSAGPATSTASTQTSCSGGCDGDASVTITLGTGPFSYQWNDPGSQTTATASALCAGSYLVSVTDGLGCTTVDTAVVSAPNAININFNVSDATCTGSCDGGIMPFVSGGSVPFTYSWNCCSGSNQFNGNLCIGTYILTVTDSFGCTGVDSATVASPNTIIINESSTDALCNGACDGTASVAPSGGTAPYIINWSTGSNSANISGLCPGTYSVTVTDANFCTNTASVIISEPTPIAANGSTVQSTCGSCNGEASVTPSGGSSPYTYLWSNTQSTATITGLCAGTYDVTVTDASGCTQLASVAVSDSTGPSVTASLNTVPSCASSCDGIADVLASGGTPYTSGTPYLYQWDDPATQTTTQATGLCTGTYSVTATDSLGCIGIDTVLVPEPLPIMAMIAVTNESCGGSCDGSATSTPTGGTSPYTYQWDAAAGSQTTATATGLCAGTYSLTVTDANNCTVTDIATVNSPTAITSNLSASDPNCNGSCDGSAVVNPTGGAPGYSYQWSNGSNSQGITSLCGGSYYVTITDGAGCSVTDSAQLSDPAVLSASLSGVNLQCNGDCDGQASAVVNGGTSPYNYNWVPSGSTSATATGLCAGTQYLTVTDDNGCLYNDSTSLTEPAAMILDSSQNVDATCLVCNGQSTLYVSGGVPPYSYQWCNGETGQTATALCAGLCQVTVTDATNCSDIFSIPVSNINGPNVNVTSQDVSCNGACDGQANASASGGVTPYTFLWDDPAPPQTDSTATALCAGPYNVIVTDNNGCTTTTPVTINEPTVLTLSFNSTPLSCSGPCDGSAQVIASGGVTPYAYQWDNGGTNDTIQNVCADTFCITVTDANNCTATGCVTVTAPSLLNATMASTDVSCNGNCDGTATITVNSGTPPFTYNWSSGCSTSATCSALCAGTYDVTVTDASGCFTTLQAVIVEPSLISATLNPTFPTCGNNDGDLTVVPSGGTPYTVGNPYQYQWDAAAGSQTSATATGLAAGSYSVTVTDSTGCTGVFSYNLPNANAPQITFDLVQDALCNSQCNGAINISVTGVNGPPFTYLWIPGGQTTDDIANLCAGNYSVQVTDTLGCISFGDTVIDEPSSITASSSSNDAACGQCDGDATLTPAGGTTPYTYQWSNGATSATATGMCAGVYQVLVTDNNNCSSTFNVGVGNTGGPTGETLSITDPTCAGYCDGTATISNIVGGTPPYTYVFLPGNQTGTTVTGLCSGTYQWEITDSNGCSRVIPVILSDPAALSDSSVIVPTACGLCNGTIDVFAQGGAPPYAYSPSQNLSNLCEGVYGVTVTDNAGCIQNFTYTMPGDSAPTASADTVNVSCFGACDGQSTVTVSGGTTPYSYSWLDNTGTPLFPAQTGTTATGLCAGDYIIQITDGAGCQAFASTSISQPDSIEFSTPVVNNILCNGLCNGTGNVIPIGGNLPFTFSWPSGSTNAGDTGLCAGTYVVTITDVNNCQETQSLTVTEPTPNTLSIDNVVDAMCYNSLDGSIDITTGGGTSPYSYAWTGPAAFTDTIEDIASLNPGQYCLTVTDANGCTVDTCQVVDTTTVVIVQCPVDTTVCEGTDTLYLYGNAIGNPTITYQWLDASYTLIDTSQNLLVTGPAVGATNYILVASDGPCTDTCTSTLTVEAYPTADAGPGVQIVKGNSTVIGGAPTGSSGSTYTWTPGVSLDDSTSANPTANPTETTTYTVTVTSPSGCQATDTMTVEVLPFITFPDGFSPNGDGKNDTWIIDFIELYPEAVVEIYNRWGELLFRDAAGYKVPWDGTYNGKPVPVGTYYYIVDLNHPDAPEPYTGPLTIIR